GRANGGGGGGAEVRRCGGAGEEGTPSNLSLSLSLSRPGCPHPPRSAPPHALPSAHPWLRRVTSRPVRRTFGRERPIARRGDTFFSRSRSSATRTAPGSSPRLSQTT